MHRCFAECPEHAQEELRPGFISVHKSTGLWPEQSALFAYPHLKKDVDRLERHQGEVHEHSDLKNVLVGD